MNSQAGDIPEKGQSGVVLVINDGECASEGEAGEAAGSYSVLGGSDASLLPATSAVPPSSSGFNSTNPIDANASNTHMVVGLSISASSTRSNGSDSTSSSMHKPATPASALTHLANATTTVTSNSNFAVSVAQLASLISPSKDPVALATLGHANGILAALATSEETGLDALHARDLHARAVAFGTNRLPPVPPKSIFYFCLKALSDKIMILLSVVAFVSLGIGIYEDVTTTDPTEKVHWIEGFSVLVAVIIIVLVSSINDLQKDRQFRKLNAKKEDRKVKGIRNGQTQLISIYDILVGDILLLEPGDVIGADGIFVSGMGLKCDESSATGEADAVKKGASSDPFILSGSKVSEGIGKYVVTGVGEHSFFGKIMMAMRTENEDTPLQVKLDGLAERIAKIGTAFAILLFILLFLKYIIIVLKTNGFGSDTDAQESGAEVAAKLIKILLTSIAIVAVAVPEGLPLAVTLALAYATTRMMRDNNLVRVLSACETMGNATTVCSDKTGTLTQNRMTVVAGVVGKNVAFEGDAECAGLRAKLGAVGPGAVSVRSVDSSDGVVVEGDGTGNGTAAVKALMTGTSGKRPGPSGSVLLNRIMEGVAVNSSAFAGRNEATGTKELVGSKTEVALLEWAKKSGYDYEQLRKDPKVTVVQVFPFSSERKSMATLVKVESPDGSSNSPPVYRVYAKGAPEIVMGYCDRVVLLPFSPSPTAIQNQSSLDTPLKRSLGAIPAVGSRSNPHSSVVYPLEPKLRTDYGAIMDMYAVQSLRTICLAYREFSGEEFETLVSGPLRERVTAAKKDEKEHLKDKLLATATEGVVRTSSPEPSTPSPQPDVLDVSSSAGNTPMQHSSLLRNNTLGSSLLMIPNNQTTINGETKSFIESNYSDEELLTEADILSHPLAFSEIAAKGLTLASIVGIEDPLRPGVTDAVAACKEAGVFVRMVTGDNVMTAKSIATKCGIYQRGGLVMEGEHFRKLTPERMHEILPRLQVLARSSPLDKQILVSNLKQMGETVAVTGDGTNDGPALKMADIGFSMGIAGTEVAKEASSIILMDDSFSSVVKAILWGRSVNDSVKKFLQFQLSVNISAVLITLISALADSQESSALTVVQLLWVNLIMDTLAALALATELPTNELLQRPPESKKAPLISFTMWKMILGQAFLQVTVNLILLFAGPALFGFQELIDAGGINGARNPSNVVQQQILTMKTVIFNTFVLLQLFSLVNSRRIDSHVNVFLGILRNPPFFIILTAITIAQVIIIEYGGIAFQTVRLTGLQWLVCIIASCLTLPWGVIIRLIPNDIFKLFGFKVYEETAYHDMIAVDTLSVTSGDRVGHIAPRHGSATQTNDFLISRSPAGQAGRTRASLPGTLDGMRPGGGEVGALGPGVAEGMGRRRSAQEHVMQMKEKLEHMNLKVYSFVRGGLRRRETSENMGVGAVAGVGSISGSQAMSHSHHPSSQVVSAAAVSKNPHHVRK